MLVQIKPCNKSKTTNFIKVWLYLKKIYKCISLSLKRTQLSYSHLPLDVAYCFSLPQQSATWVTSFPLHKNVSAILHSSGAQGVWFFPLTLERSRVCSRGGPRAASAARPGRAAAIPPRLRCPGSLLGPPGVPRSQAGAPRLAGVPEEPAEGVLQGPVTSQRGRVAPSQVLRGGGSNVGEVPAAKSSGISDTANTADTLGVTAQRGWENLPGESKEMELPTAHTRIKVLRVKAMTHLHQAAPAAPRWHRAKGTQGLCSLCPLWGWLISPLHRPCQDKDTTRRVSALPQCQTLPQADCAGCSDHHRAELPLLATCAWSPLTLGITSVTGHHRFG